MIKNIFRFHGRGSLNYLFRNGSTVRTQAISLRYVRNKRSSLRLAVIVSKKVSKKAVVRNRIRRRVYEIVRIINKEAKTDWSYDISIQIFDDSIAHIQHKELTDQITKLLKKSQII